MLWMKKINSFVSAYQQQIRKGDIQKNHHFLLKYVMQVKARLEKSFSKEYLLFTTRNSLNR